MRCSSLVTTVVNLLIGNSRLTFMCLSVVGGWVHLGNRVDRATQRPARLCLCPEGFYAEGTHSQIIQALLSDPNTKRQRRGLEVVWVGQCKVVTEVCFGTQDGGFEALILPCWASSAFLIPPHAFRANARGASSLCLCERRKKGNLSSKGTLTAFR